MELTLLAFYALAFVKPETCTAISLQPQLENMSLFHYESCESTLIRYTCLNLQLSLGYAGVTYSKNCLELQGDRQNLVDLNQTIVQRM